MKKNKAKTMLDAGKPIFGTFAGLGFSDPTMIEVAAYAGFDYIIIDMEHSTFSLQLVQEMVRAGDATGITTMVRVPENNSKTILRVLETGVQGIMIPRTKDREDVEKLIDAVYYRPYGNRGIFTGSRAADYSTVPFKEHIRISNEDILVGTMIEDSASAQMVEDILTVEGLDFAFIGPADLSRSLDVLGELDHPKVAETIDGIFSKAKAMDTSVKLGIPAGHSAYNRTAKELIDAGASMITGSPCDASLMLRAFKQQLEDMKKGL